MSEIPELVDGEQKVFFKAGGEWCYLWTPETFRKDTPIPVVIQNHGSGGFVREGRADWLEEETRALSRGFDPNFKIKIMNAVMKGGACAIAGSHACGNHWGNPCSVEANVALFDTLVASPHIDSDRMGLFGGGLGGVLIWNSVLAGLNSKVKAVAVLQSVASIEATIREQKFKGTPLPKTAIYHGEVDENIPAESNAIPLEKALKKAGGKVELHIFPGVGHNVYFMGNTIEEYLEAFFADNL
jgi:hypothetical protein